jgi:acyl-CoA thioesterase I
MKRMHRIGFSLLLVMIFSCNETARQNHAAAESKVKEAEGKPSAKKSILFFGDSLTAGYGLDEPGLAFPGLIQRRIDSLGLPYTVDNAGVSGETSAGGEGRIEWILKQPVDIFILELGANDGLRGIPVEETRENLQQIMDSVKVRNPDVEIILAGMMVPPNMGPDYGKAFQKIFPELAARNNATLIPFLLAGVGGEPALNQLDGIHPTPEGHRMVMETVWKALDPLVR